MTEPAPAPERIPIALTIAGSDSSGGAGIQADLKTFSAFGVYGASVVTALTAQNTRGVQGVHAVPAAFVAAQLDSVLSDLTVGAIKTGMLADAAIVATVARRLRAAAPVPLVVDPVMVATSGDVLLTPDAVGAL
jgi:hydroxymethylpyrimidine/phosphomethylpyrimidine kinase